MHIIPVCDKVLNSSTSKIGRDIKMLYVCVRACVCVCVCVCVCDLVVFLRCRYLICGF